MLIISTMQSRLTVGPSDEILEMIYLIEWGKNSDTLPAAHLMGVEVSDSGNTIPDMKSSVLLTKSNLAD